MGHRLTQISTRTGDDGTTGLGDNTRVSKNSLRVHAMGDVDELNAQLGVLLCEDLPQDVRTLLVTVQHELFNLGGELSIPGYRLLKDDAVQALDAALAHYNARLPALQEFILPGGTRAAALAHVARTIARRAERFADATPVPELAADPRLKQCLLQTGLAPSGTEADRLIKAGAVSVNQEVVRVPSHRLDTGEHILRSGKKWARIQV